MKKKKSLIALLLIAIIGVVGGTFAYFTSTDTFTNIFRTKAYHVEVKEVFTSPSDWTPGTETPKTVTATNKGDVDAAVRIWYEEEWRDSSNRTMDLTDSNQVRAALLNMPDDFASHWTSEHIESTNRTYYYYKTKLAKNASTSAFINSVTFNPAVEITTSHECDSTSVAGEETCTTVTSGFGGGTYKLTIHVETAQYDQYQAIWGTTVSIAES